MNLTRWFWRLFLIYSGMIFALVAAISLLLTAGILAPQPGGAGRLMAGVWLIALAAIVAGAGVSWFCLKKMLDPLARFTQGIRALAAGEDEPLVPIVGGDEIGVLEAAFEQMRRKLARRIDQQHENAARLQAVLGSMVEGVLAVGPDRTILLTNRAGSQLLDFTAPEPVGRSLLEVTRARPVYEAVSQALHSNVPVEREFESPGTPRRTLALRATRLPGEPCPGVMIVLHDVSELRRLENLRRELVANVSHELKTPLSAIKAYAETLRLGAVNDPENNLAFVVRIEEQAERLHQLILDILQIARVEAGQEVFEIVDVPLGEVIEEAVAQFAELAAGKQIVLKPEICSPAIAARADEEGIRTILSNQVDNAIKYTPAGGTIFIRCRAGETTVTLEVQDTGIGIAPQDQARVFERFYRVDRARSRELGGTGLGLSIVKHLAQAFGGLVQLDSQPRRGSIFRIQLPRGKDALP
jgi:two-component system phosphate regulon sensor histidine kinase PhoR